MINIKKNQKNKFQTTLKEASTSKYITIFL
jgi:hypothetical protein